MVNISLEHGNSDASCYAYSAVGSVLGLTFGDYLRGFRFAQLGLDLAEQPGMDRLRARVYLAFGNLAKPSARHVRTGQQVARHAFEAAQQVGDLTYAAISCNNLLTQLLASGTPLADVQREAEAGPRLRGPRSFRSRRRPRPHTAAVDTDAPRCDACFRQL